MILVLIPIRCHMPESNFEAEFCSYCLLLSRQVPSDSGVLHRVIKIIKLPVHSNRWRAHSLLRWIYATVGVLNEDSSSKTYSHLARIGANMKAFRTNITNEMNFIRVHNCYPLVTEVILFTLHTKTHAEFYERCFTYMIALHVLQKFNTNWCVFIVEIFYASW